MKQPSPVSACTTEGTEPRSQGGQSAGTWAGAPPTAEHTAQLALPPQGTQSHQFSFVLVPACSGRGEKMFRWSLPWNKMQTKTQQQQIQSAQSREALSTLGHALLPCFMWKSVTCSVQVRHPWAGSSWLFHGIHVHLQDKRQNRRVFTYVVRLLESSGAGASSVLIPELGFL